MPIDEPPEAWIPVKIWADGTWRGLGVFARFDLAAAFAQTLAEALALADAERRMMGRPESGVVGVILGHDGWDIRAMVADIVALCPLCGPDAPPHRLYRPHVYGQRTRRPRATVAVPTAVSYARAGDDARRRLLTAYAQKGL